MKIHMAFVCPRQNGARASWGKRKLGALRKRLTIFGPLLPCFQVGVVEQNSNFLLFRQVKQ